MEESQPVKPLTYLGLLQIKDRSRRARPDGPTHSLTYTTESMKDVPVLITEVERLQEQNRRLAAHNVELGRRLGLFEGLYESVLIAMQEAEEACDDEHRYAIRRSDGDELNEILDKIEKEGEDDGK